MRKRAGSSPAVTICSPENDPFEVLLVTVVFNREEAMTGTISNVHGLQLVTLSQINWQNHCYVALLLHLPVFHQIYWCTRCQSSFQEFQGAKLIKCDWQQSSQCCRETAKSFAAHTPLGEFNMRSHSTIWSAHVDDNLDPKTSQHTTLYCAWFEAARTHLLNCPTLFVLHTDRQLEYAETNINSFAHSAVYLYAAQSSITASKFP